MHVTALVSMGSRGHSSTESPLMGRVDLPSCCRGGSESCRQASMHQHLPSTIDSKLLVLPPVWFQYYAGSIKHGGCKNLQAWSTPAECVASLESVRQCSRAKLQEGQHAPRSKPPANSTVHIHEWLRHWIAALVQQAHHIHAATTCSALVWPAATFSPAGYVDQPARLSLVLRSEPSEPLRQGCTCCMTAHPALRLCCNAEQSTEWSVVSSIGK
jgi:hypothetical protein